VRVWLFGSHRQRGARRAAVGSAPRPGRRRRAACRVVPQSSACEIQATQPRADPTKIFGADADSWDGVNAASQHEIPAAADEVSMRDFPPGGDTVGPGGGARRSLRSDGWASSCSATRIDEGGFGAVYRCEQPLLGREAVVKVLHQRLRRNDVVLQRFMREAQLASRLDHPYARTSTRSASSTTTGCSGSRWRWCREPALNRWLRERGPLALDQLVPFLRVRRRCRADGARPRHRPPRPQTVECDGDRARGTAVGPSCSTSASPSCSTTRRCRHRHAVSHPERASRRWRRGPSAGPSGRRSARPVRSAIDAAEAATLTASMTPPAAPRPSSTG